MEEDAGVGDEFQTEVKSRGQILRDALTDWRVVYMALRCAILRLPECTWLIYYVKRRLYQSLPLIYRVLPYPHRYTWL